MRMFSVLVDDDLCLLSHLTVSFVPPLCHLSHLAVSFVPLSVSFVPLLLTLTINVLLLKSTLLPNLLLNLPACGCEAEENFPQGQSTPQLGMSSQAGNGGNLLPLNSTAGNIGKSSPSIPLDSLAGIVGHSSPGIIAGGFGKSSTAGKVGNAFTTRELRGFIPSHRLEFHRRGFIA